MIEYTYYYKIQGKLVFFKERKYNSMKKRILSAALALMCMCSASQLAMAGEINPVVEVDDREIVFADQKAVIVEGEGRTLVPARGLFEYMGADVSWNDEKQLVTIEKGSKRIDITIGSDIMVVYTYPANPMELLTAPPAKEEIKLDAPARLMNDRTMIPLRAISESLETEVKWDEATCTVSIFTKDYTAPVVDDTTEAPAEGTTEAVKKNVSVSLTASADKVKVGETFDVIVNVANLKEGSEAIAGFAAGLIYDHSKLEYVENSMQIIGKDMNKFLSAVNADFSADSLKSVAVTVNADSYTASNGEYVKFTFKALSEETATIQLSNRYTSRGYDTSITIDNGNTINSLNKDLHIDTTPITIN